MKGDAVSKPPRLTPPGAVGAEDGVVKVASNAAGREHEERAGPLVDRRDKQHGKSLAERLTPWDSSQVGKESLQFVPIVTRLDG